MSRRSLLERGLAAAALLSLPVGRREWLGGALQDERKYVNAARRAESWIRRWAVRDAAGVHWPADPEKTATVSTDMYNGMPGVILFYLELWAVTGDREMLAMAAGGANYLISTFPTDAAKLGDDGAGLYSGAAGHAYILERTHAATGEARHREGALRAMALLHAAASPKGAGVQWNEAYDIVAGNAGIGLTMIWAQRALADGAALGDAIKAGRRLVEVGIPDRGGLKWELAPSVPRRYPNFSHGTAGVSYFLATLYLETRERAFLDAAIRGAIYLDAISIDTGASGRKIFHHEPGGEELFYLSWCHGPAGTARLYHQLAKATGEKRYRDQVPRFAQGIVDSGVPEMHPDLSGYWNNISQCCGNAGVCEYFLSMHRLTEERRHLEFAMRVADDMLARGTSDSDGLKWIQAENRISPQEVVAQTGLMQGAAGVGLALLHLDGAMQGRAPVISLPDNPDWSA